MQLIEALGKGRVQATTTPEVIQEFVHVRARRRSRADAAALGGWFADLLAPLIVVDANALSAGLQLFDRLPRLGAFDAVLAATAISAGAAALISADAGFASVGEELRWLDPSAAAAQLIA